MVIISFTFEDESIFSFPPEDETGHVEGSWESPPTDRHSAYVAGLVDEFMQTELGYVLTLTCGDVTNVSVFCTE